MSQQERILARAERNALAGNQRVADILRQLATETIVDL